MIEQVLYNIIKKYLPEHKPINWFDPKLNFQLVKSRGKNILDKPIFKGHKYTLLWENENL